MKTPRIDEVLAKFRLQGATSAGPSISSAATSGTEAESSPRSAGATPGKPQAASRMTQVQQVKFAAESRTTSPPHSHRRLPSLAGVE